MPQIASVARVEEPHSAVRFSPGVEEGRFKTTLPPNAQNDALQRVGERLLVVANTLRLNGLKLAEPLHGRQRARCCRRLVSRSRNAGSVACQCARQHGDLLRHFETFQ